MNRRTTLLVIVLGLGIGCVRVEVRYLGAGSDGATVAVDASPGAPDESAPGGDVPVVAADDAAPPVQDDGEAAAPATGPVSIGFEARVGAQPFACGQTFTGLGTAASPWEATDFRLYVHDVRLVRDGVEAPLALDPDSPWQHADVALLDFEDRTGACSNGTVETNGAIRGRAPEGPWDGIRFRVGVPRELNHLDVSTAPSPLNIASLYWGWTNGYKFARIDGRSGSQAFHFHLAAIQCKASPDGGPATCARPDVAEIELSGADPTAVPIVLDFAALVANSDLGANTPDTSPGCESAANDPDCAALFEALGVSFEDGSSDPATQTVFSWGT